MERTEGGGDVIKLATPFYSAIDYIDNIQRLLTWFL